MAWNRLNRLNITWWNGYQYVLLESFDEFNFFYTNVILCLLINGLSNLLLCWTLHYWKGKLYLNFEKFWELSLSLDGLVKYYLEWGKENQHGNILTLSCKMLKNGHYVLPFYTIMHETVKICKWNWKAPCTGSFTVIVTCVFIYSRKLNCRHS